MKKIRLIGTQFGVLIMSVFMAGIANAEQPSTACPADQDTRPLIHQSKQKPATDTEAPVEIHADSVELDPDNISRFSGNVTLEQAGKNILADEIVYQKTRDAVTARGHVTFKSMVGDTFETHQLDLNMTDNTGQTDTVRFSLSKDGRGTAQEARFLENDRVQLRKVRYTTCPPEKESWYLGVSRLDLDRENDIGIARNAIVVFKHVPIFYWPYLDFPLSGQRKSGFLAPSFGSSDKSGSSLTIPFYWNIAPAYDDTLRPRYFSDRGTQIGNEFRYLGRGYSGILNAESLPNDEIYLQDRAAASFRHQQAFSHRWSANIDMNWVSDNDYLDDFSNSLAVAGQSHLRREGLLRYRGETWNFDARALSYQTIDTSLLPNELPYEMLPQLRLSTRIDTTPNQFNLLLVNEWTRFERDNSIIGSRLRIQPEVNYPWQTSYSFLTPRIGGYYWSYDLSETPQALRPVNFEEREHESVPYFALDSGLFFDRNYQWHQRAYTHTFEPRLFFIRVPYRDQDGFQDFDTDLPDFRFAQLFRINRFVGGDRVGDTRQLTLAVTTRVIDEETGSERFQASLGQIRYFEDRRVNLPAATVDRGKSDLVGEITTLLRSNLYWQASVRWRQETQETQEAQTYLQYHPGENMILNAGYLRTPDLQEQTDVSFQWPLSTRWTLSGRQNYSLTNRQNLESYAGLGYRSCCWAIRLLGNRRISTTGDQVNSVLFQFQLTGLSQMGDTLDSPLKQSLFADF